MPLIDDDTQGSDQRQGEGRRSKPYWPWILALVGFVVLWLAFTTLVTVIPQLQSQQAVTSAAATRQQQVQRDLVNQAQSALRSGSPAMASRFIDQIPANGVQEVMDKHTYFRTAAQVKRKNGEPAAAASFYERFLVMGTGVGKEECQSCHSPGTIRPAHASDLESSSLGTEYVAALRAAGQLKAARKGLLRDLKKQPNSPRSHLLLYHVEKALGNSAAAAEHASALKEAPSGG